ncbi:hypothetical protein PIB30_085825, partial [Stylosanthes scabra]|nr:hypothetical protein [Stylosanthes scabra]
QGGIMVAAGPAIPNGEQDLYRLLSEEPAMGLRLVQRLHMSRKLWQALRYLRSHLLLQIHHHGLVVRNPNQNGIRQYPKPHLLSLSISLSMSVYVAVVG